MPKYDCPVSTIDYELRTIDSECTNISINYDVEYDPDNSLSIIESNLKTIENIDKELRENLDAQFQIIECMKSNMHELYDVIKDLTLKVQKFEQNEEEQ